MKQYRRNIVRAFFCTFDTNKIQMFTINEPSRQRCVIVVHYRLDKFIMIID